MIHVSNLGVSFNCGTRENSVLKGLNFHLARSEFVTILGRSGVGKSVFLDVVMGLEQPKIGYVEMENPRLKMGYVFQKPALLPWLNVYKNVGLPLKIAKAPKRKRPEMIEAALQKVGLLHAKNNYPFQLSGGMAQRVGIARALVQDPDLLLMDEPFSALDPILRENLNINLLKLWGKNKKTVLFVTHSIDEAVILSDRILILERGCFIHEIKVDLPRPRGFDTFQTKDFASVRRKIHALLPNQPNLPAFDTLTGEQN